MKGISYIDFYTLITYTSYITYTYNNKGCIDYFIIILIFTIHYGTYFSFYKQLLLYYLIKTIELMTREAVSFEKVFDRTKFLAF